jgi:hemerythrin-like domain-containing protein
MKRHKSLYPLSHDHHHALVQARNLRLVSPDSPQQTAIAFLAFWDADLKIHFRQEEEVLLPLLAKYASVDQPEIIETLKQHVEIRRALMELKDQVNKSDPSMVEKLQGLGTLIENHVRYEENHLFPAIEAVVPEEQLWEMNRLISREVSQS